MQLTARFWRRVGKMSKSSSKDSSTCNGLPFPVIVLACSHACWAFFVSRFASFASILISARFPLAPRRGFAYWPLSHCKVKKCYEVPAKDLIVKACWNMSKLPCSGKMKIRSRQNLKYKNDYILNLLMPIMPWSLSWKVTNLFFLLLNLPPMIQLPQIVRLGIFHTGNLDFQLILFGKQFKNQGPNWRFLR